MHLVGGIADGFGFYFLAVELVGLEGLIDVAGNGLVLYHPVGGVEGALYFVLGYAGNQLFHKLGAELYFIKGLREGFAVNVAVHLIVYRVDPGEYVNRRLGVVLPLKVYLAGNGVYGSVKTVGVSAGGGMGTAVNHFIVAVQHRHVCGGGYLAYAAAGLILVVCTAGNNGGSCLPSVGKGAVAQYAVGGEFLAGQEGLAVYHAAGLFKVEAAAFVAALAAVAGGSGTAKHEIFLEGFNGNVGLYRGHLNLYIAEVQRLASLLNGLHKAGDIYTVAVHSLYKLEKYVSDVGDGDGFFAELSFLCGFADNAQVAGIRSVGFLLYFGYAHGEGSGSGRDGNGIRKGMYECLYAGGLNGVFQSEVTSVFLNVHHLLAKLGIFAFPGKAHGLGQHLFGVIGNCKAGGIRSVALAVAGKVQVYA